MPLRNPQFQASRALYENREADDEAWDAAVFKRPAPNKKPWHPSPVYDPTFVVKDSVRGNEVTFKIVVDPKAAASGYPRHLYDIRVLSGSLNSMEEALLKAAGFEETPVVDTSTIDGPVESDAMSRRSQAILTEKQADMLVNLLSHSDDSKIAVLALAQRFCVRLRETNQIKQHRRLRRLMITICENLWSDSENQLDETLREVFMSYGYAVAMRLANDEPREWAAYYRATMIAFDGAYTRDMFEEMEFLWNLVCSMGLRPADERLDAADVIGALEDEMEDLCKFGLHLYFENHAASTISISPSEKGAVVKLRDMDLKLEEKVAIPIASPEDALTCTVCWCQFLSHNPPVTFGDGRSVCRGCVQKKRRQLSQVEKLRNFARMSNWDLEEEPQPLSEIFGGVPDLTLGRVVELTSSISLKNSPDQTEPEASSPVYFRRLGASYYREGKYSQAIAAYTQAIELFPNLATNYSNRSAAFKKLNRSLEAYGDARTAVEKSGGRWAKAHYRIFESCALFPPTKGSLIRAHAKRMSYGSQTPEEAAAEAQIEMSEEEYLKTWRKRRSAYHAGDRKIWLTDTDRIVEAIASLTRAHALGEKVENNYRRMLSVALLTDAKMFDEFPEENGKLERIRKSSFVLKIARELFQCNMMMQAIHSSPSLENSRAGPTLIGDIPKFQAANRNDFDCTLCYSLLYQPTTLPCGHSFCMGCAVKAMDHSVAQGEAKCPMCRAPLKNYIDSLNDLAFQNTNKHGVIDLGLKHVQVNLDLDGFVRFLFPDEYRTRIAQTQAEEEPVIVSSASAVPNEADIPWIPYDSPVLCCVPSSFALWEPAERLMMRRLAFLRSELRKDKNEEQSVTGMFGICWETDTATSKFGVLMKIDSMSSSAEGALIVWCQGAERFEVISEDSRDGYKTAHIRLLDTEAHRPTELSNKVETFRKKHRPAELLSMSLDARRNGWQNAPEELLLVELEQYWETVKRWTPEWQSVVDGSLCNLSNLPYCIALVLRFPDLLNFYLMFGKRTRDSFKERVRLVLLYGDSEGKQWTPAQNIADHANQYPELLNGDISQMV